MRTCDCNTHHGFYLHWATGYLLACGSRQRACLTCLPTCHTRSRHRRCRPAALQRTCAEAVATAALGEGQPKRELVEPCELRWYGQGRRGKEGTRSQQGHICSRAVPDIYAWGTSWREEAALKRLCWAGACLLLQGGKVAGHSHARGTILSMVENHVAVLIHNGHVLLADVLQPQLPKRQPQGPQPVLAADGGAKHLTYLSLYHVRGKGGSTFGRLSLQRHLVAWPGIRPARAPAEGRKNTAPFHIAGRARKFGLGSAGPSAAVSRTGQLWRPA